MSKQVKLCVEVNGSEQTEHSTAPSPGGSNRDVPFTGALSQIEDVIRRELDNTSPLLVEMQNSRSYENWYELVVRVGVLVEEYETDPDNPNHEEVFDWSFVPIVGGES